MLTNNNKILLVKYSIEIRPICLNMLHLQKLGKMFSFNKSESIHLSLCEAESDFVFWPQCTMLLD